MEVKINYETLSFDFSELDNLDDFSLVRRALKRYKWLCQMFRSGGLGWQCELARRALKALDRIEQPRLL